MGRIHLFEFEDQSWCPSFIRETTTDFLLAYYTAQNVYKPAFEKISEVLDITKTNAIIDCCSGSGGPIKNLREHLDKDNKKIITITLTDKYPNLNLFKTLESIYPNKIFSYKESINASNIPPQLKGMRTLFSAFHHFRPPEALKILRNAVEQKAPIGIFEFTQRHPKIFLRLLFTPFIVLFRLPSANRLTLKKIIFTYLLPITPLTHTWEFFVSSLRTYSIKELHNLIEKVNAPEYYWEIGRLWSDKAKRHITYLIGYPKEHHVSIP